MPTLYLIDGMAIAYRAYFAFMKRPLRNSKGENTSAVYGFATTMNRIIEQEKPDFLAVAMDCKEPTFRHVRFEPYKANRESMPEDLVTQLPWLDQLIEAYEVPLFKTPGFEADDLIGTLAQKAESEGLDVVMVTPDKDYLQLVTEKISIYKPSKASEEPDKITLERVPEKFGVGPERVIDILALMGDASDNIPGVKGVGEKTATKLVQEFGSLEQIYENVEKVKGKVKDKLIADKEMAFLSKELVTIKTDCEVEFDLEKLKLSHPDYSKRNQIFAELDFWSLIKGEIEPEVEKVEEIETDYQLVDTLEGVKKLAKILKKNEFAFDTETTSLSPEEAELVGLSFSMEKGKAFYIPTVLSGKEQGESAESGQMDIFAQPKQKNFTKEILEILKPVLEDPKVPKFGQNTKYDCRILKAKGVSVKGISFDTMIANYVLPNPETRRNSLDEMCLTYLNYQKIPTKELIGTGKKMITMDKVPVEDVKIYACEDADFTFRLKEVLAPMVKEQGVEELFHKIELPLIEVLTEMEANGIYIDDYFFSEMGMDLSQQLVKIKDDIYAMAGENFNINSTQQLGVILFDKLGLRVVKKTKTGRSTDVRVLETLAKEHPLPERLLEYRSLTKLKSTYVDALPSMIFVGDKRIHGNFNQTIASTGRLSSTDPNLQNIPNRTEIGRKIRMGFVPQEKDSVLLAADYSQIELRIMAHISGDANLRKAFQEELDVHRATAALVFEKSYEEVSDQERYQAKAVNFGIIYGEGGFSLGKRLGISPKEGNQFIKDYFAKYSGVYDYLESTKQKAKEENFVETLCGRRRSYSDIHSKNRMMREAAERAAINFPIQGTAADMIKIAMINIHKILMQKACKTKMVLQVHDELVFEIPNSELDEMKVLLKSEMEKALPLEVPVKVDVGIGGNWLEAH
ncbi:MAG: DNA polymerase I [Calditrichaeota bacterium]|nr:MAG: DNA polymerase I [Calditrichota bacterium]